ncbi:6-phosphogluconolactonase [Pseudohoeflea coraliihabitans]|uniref:6-phosphogluconolactonase n=1 Tax=Pseudohoeflea coraliihabitans TaxID=2860393 RepID=A0ABS6WMZ9_9HYPH|nr:6-phosphogluconolactonase [Pseudohoeflea sp. DP4N28-3]MBW3097336.1 6-phosphogluconolactonase [Pseudohoeflea sp. DP4N28-3]
MAVDLNAFDDREMLAERLAARIAEALESAIAARGRAQMAVSGGGTPVRLFETLSRLPLDWAKVTITLVDERMVPPDHARSNEKLVVDHLLKNEALQARFLPLWSDMSEKVETVAMHASEAIVKLPQPFDIVILGMGTDGHTASFFPDGSHLETAIDPHCEDAVVAMMAPGAGEPRLTLSLPCLVAARLLVLHIEGSEKRRVLEAALSGGADSEMPVRAVLRNAPAPVSVYWAP